MANFSSRNFHGLALAVDIDANRTKNKIGKRKAIFVPVPALLLLLFALVPVRRVSGLKLKMKVG